MSERVGAAAPAMSQATERRADTANVPARPYRRRMPIFWWVRRRSYLLFVAREVSSVFVAWFVVYLLLMVRALGQGEDAYERFVDWSANPIVVAVNIVALAFVVLHAVTWFNLAPQAMVLKLRGRKVPPSLVAAAHFGAWLVVSAVVAVIVYGLP
jgi:fumarate reductase subunit C